jgi:hypothetical protein
MSAEGVELGARSVKPLALKVTVYRSTLAVVDEDAAEVMKGIC